MNTNHTLLFGSHKVREIMLQDMGTFDVCNHCGILDSGKFFGEMPHAVRDYNEPDELSGNSSEGFGAFWRTGHRYYFERTDGFVDEISRAGYERLGSEYAEHCERESEANEASDVLADMEEEEHGPCDSCQVCMINGVRCHEAGCRRYARLVRQRRLVENLEAY